MRLPTEIHLKDHPVVRASLEWQQAGPLATVVFRGVHILTYGGETATMRVGPSGRPLSEVEYHRTPKAALRSIGWEVAVVSDVEAL